MKSLAHSSDMFVSKNFLFQNGSPEQHTVLTEQEKKEQAKRMEKKMEEKKAQLERATEIFYKDFEQYKNEQLRELNENISQDHPGYKNCRLTINSEGAFEMFQLNASIAYPRKGQSWQSLVRDSNMINSAKKTFRESREDDPQIFNLLQTDENINKVALHLEEKFGALQPSDGVGIWFDQETQKTEVYFVREGREDYKILFEDIGKDEYIVTQ